MADYVSILFAEQIERKLVGGLVYTFPNNLSESQKSFVREEIGASPFGMGLQIAGHFDTLAELEAAVPAPKLGEVYSVGVDLPYDLYAYDFYYTVWRNYGPIRANDIKARFAADLPVTAAAWVEDNTVFVDYPYRADIPLAEITGNDFPILGFLPNDAVSGNYCPTVYSADGHVEIFCRVPPTTGITIKSLTYIIIDAEGGATGNRTAGISNATGGIATQSIGTNMLLDGAVTADKVSAAARTQYISIAVGTDWTGEFAPYKQNVSAPGLKSTDRAVVRFSPPEDFSQLEAQEDAFNQLYDADSLDDYIVLIAKNIPESGFNAILEVPRI